MAKALKKSSKVVNLSEVTNGAKKIIESGYPYRVAVSIEGASDILFHRWNPEAIDAKATAAKGSKAKKTDDVETYVYRNDDGEICLPGEYLRQSIIWAAKSKQDPRSPRKSAMDLFKAGIISLTPLASFGVKDWDYEDRRRVVVQRAGINRTRPAMKCGWKTEEFIFLINTPEYISYELFTEVLGNAGRLVGVGDFRPTYGRFNVCNIEVLSD